MQAAGLNEYTLPSACVAPAYLVTARSYLIDRFIPDCEVIALPMKTVAGGVLTYGRCVLPEAPDERGRLDRLIRPRKHRPAPEAAVIDLRRNFPQNWAHFLNNHLPILFHIADSMDIALSEMLALVPGRTPGYIKAAASCFGVRTMQTDDIFAGEGIVYNLRPWTAVRPVRAEWIQHASAVQEVLKQIDAMASRGPTRVFLSRRKTRTLENEDEVADWLGARGFTKVYPEDLDPPSQIKLFRNAEVIVAVHGAGLAPLLYAQPGGRLRNLVEILPCGHMTDVYRLMAGQVGCAWIGVRGRLKPKYIIGAYNFRNPFSTFSLDSFSVDVTALDQAFALAEISYSWI